MEYNIGTGELEKSLQFISNQILKSFYFPFYVLFKVSLVMAVISVQLFLSFIA